MRPGRADDFPAIAALLNRGRATRQFAPVWSTERPSILSGSGLRAEDFLLAEEGGTLTACVALWYQSSHRHAVGRDYAGPLARPRRLANTIAPITGLPYLPAVGERMNHGAISHLAAVDGQCVAPLLAGLRAGRATRPWRDVPRLAGR